jgi:hypothetical protein
LSTAATKIINRVHPAGTDTINLGSIATAGFSGANRVVFLATPETVDFAITGSGVGFSYGQVGSGLFYTFRLGSTERLSINYAFTKAVTPTPMFGVGTDPARIFLSRVGEPFLANEAIAPNQTGRFERLLGPGDYTVQMISIVNWGVQGASLTQASGSTRFDVHLAAVPEPATWATMILGFGLTGAALRRRSARRQNAPGKRRELMTASTG